MTNSRIKVLFVDDDQLLGNVTTLQLREYGYEVNYRTSLKEIAAVITDFHPDMIVLDVEIGEDNGIQTAPYIQSMAPDTPILFVSSHLESNFVVKAMNAGGVAYLRKPFEIEELIAYINKHANHPVTERVRVGMFELNTDENLLLKEAEEVKKLTLFESRLLNLLISNKNRVVRRELIEQDLWGDDNMDHEHSINNFIAKLRKALSPDPNLELQTIHQLGYKLLERSRS